MIAVKTAADLIINLFSFIVLRLVMLFTIVQFRRFLICSDTLSVHIKKA